MSQPVGYSQTATTISKNELPNFGACRITLPTLLCLPFVVPCYEWRIMRKYRR
jgi:hypothetical protein